GRPDTLLRETALRSVQRSAPALDASTGAQRKPGAETRKRSNEAPRRIGLLDFTPQRRRTLTAIAAYSICLESAEPVVSSRFRYSKIHGGRATRRQHASVGCGRTLRRAIS